MNITSGIIFFATLIAFPLMAFVPAGPEPAGPPNPESSHTLGTTGALFLSADPAAASGDDDEPWFGGVDSKKRGKEPAGSLSLSVFLALPPFHLERLYVRFRQLLI